MGITVGILNYIVCATTVCLVAYATHTLNEISNKLLLICGYTQEAAVRATVSIVTWGVLTLILFSVWNAVIGYPVVAGFEAYLCVVLMVFGLLYRRSIRLRSPLV